MREQSVIVHGEPGSELARTSSYYDRVAERYDDQVDGLPGNRALRETFRQRVATLAGPGGTILDFGCGTGTDAAWYAERGHHVLAYDISAGMVDVLRARCAAEIADGRITPIAGSTWDLAAALERCPPMSAISANFAVLNHVDHLGPLFDLFCFHLLPQGSVVASLLNPWYRGDMRRRWWWTGLARSPWTGAITAHGEVTTHRHFARTVRRLGRPGLALAELARCGATGWVPFGRMGALGTTADVFYYMTLRRCP
jgi:SAM-dependent methyltransferase